MADLRSNQEKMAQWASSEGIQGTANPNYGKPMGGNYSPNVIDYNQTAQPRQEPQVIKEVTQRHFAPQPQQPVDNRPAVAFSNIEDKPGSAAWQKYFGGEGMKAKGATGYSQPGTVVNYVPSEQPTVSTQPNVVETAPLPQPINEPPLKPVFSSASQPAASKSNPSYVRGTLPPRSDSIPANGYNLNSAYLKGMLPTRPNLSSAIPTLNRETDTGLTTIGSNRPDLNTSYAPTVQPITEPTAPIGTSIKPWASQPRFSTNFEKHLLGY